MPDPTPVRAHVPLLSLCASAHLMRACCVRVCGLQWSRADLFDEAKARASPNKNAYNKHLGSAVWLAARVDAILKSRGTPSMTGSETRKRKVP